MLKSSDDNGNCRNNILNLSGAPISCDSHPNNHVKQVFYFGVTDQGFQYTGPPNLITSMKTDTSSCNIIHVSQDLQRSALNRPAGICAHFKQQLTISRSNSMVTEIGSTAACLLVPAGAKIFFFRDQVKYIYIYL